MLLLRRHLAIHYHSLTSYITELETHGVTTDTLPFLLSSTNVHWFEDPDEVM